ncbi:MAG: hypothetical protein ACSHXI_19115 [Hoeflea sp.]|uniref:hypothetical protein n=1 Tax=Hoeflea sp. TaxID=1940281 RepID=UPI003EF667B9
MRAELDLIQEIANADGWVAIDEVCGGYEIDVPEGGGAEGAAFFVALNYAELLPKIANAASMNRYSGGRQWSCYRMDGAQLSSETVSDPDARVHFIEAVLKARNFQVSRPHEIDWFSAVRRDRLTDEKSEITYLTIYLLDRPIQEMTIDQDNRFLMALRQRVDEMIFAFNPRAQEIEVYSRGGAKLHEPLASAFADSFSNEAVDLVRVEPRQVDFGPLKVKPDFDISPEDRVESVSVVKLKFWGDGMRSLYEHASDDNEIYDIMQQKLGDRSPLRCGDLMVAATVKIKRAKQHGKTLTIDLGHPSRTTLPNQTEEDRTLSIRLLERWGILSENDQLLDLAE